MNLDPRRRTTQDLDCVLRALRVRGVEGTEPGRLNGFGGVARALYDDRRRRDQFFSPSLFAEPAWDMLLDLRVQIDALRHPSVSSACIGSASPASTALRHLLVLENEGLVVRSPDPHDARRKLTRLSEKGARLMDAYLMEIALDRVTAVFR